MARALRILVAPGSYKGSLDSPAVAANISIGLRKASKKYTVRELPLADGGSGTVAVLTAAYRGEYVTCRVSGPFGDTINAAYGWVPRKGVAIIELAGAAGLALMPPQERNPCVTTTRGVGELIADALQRGAKDIILGVGDSATIDCGIGALSVLGIRFLDRKHNEIDHNCRGLIDLKTIDDSTCRSDIRAARITIATDVMNTLTGKQGAAVFARQKGATPSMMSDINRALKNFKRVIEDQYGIDADAISGAGAAGGVPAAFRAILNADVQPGFKLVAEAVNLQKHVQNSDVIITGEGRIDRQSFSGKVVGNVVAIAREHKKQVILVTGSTTRGVRASVNSGVFAYYSLKKSGRSLAGTMENAARLLVETAHTIGEDLLRSDLSPDEIY